MDHFILQFKKKGISACVWKYQQYNQLTVTANPKEVTSFGRRRRKIAKGRTAILGLVCLYQLILVISYWSRNFSGISYMPCLHGCLGCSKNLWATCSIWTRSSPDVPSNLYHSVIVWFCENGASICLLKWLSLKKWFRVYLINSNLLSKYVTISNWC